MSRPDELQLALHAGLGGSCLELKVVGARVDHLRFSMDPPLYLAGRSVPLREYVVLQIKLESGSLGTAYVLTRGQPIAAATEDVAQALVGLPLADLFTRAPQQRGRTPYQRARALVDIGAWDLAGQVSQVPTGQLVGQSPVRQPLLLVAGYRRTEESSADMARRLAGWCSEGYRSIKIAAELEGRRTEELLAEIRKLASPDDLELVLDLGFAGPDTDRIVALTRRWAPYGVTWVEDPLPVGSAREIAAIRAESELPISAGDEATPAELAGLLERDAVDVLRADTTTVGGISGLADTVAASTVPVSLHVYPEVHRHAAALFAAPSPIEMFPPRDQFDFADRFIRPLEWNRSEEGLAAPTAPGLGIRYDAEAVRAHVVTSTSFGAE